MKTVFNTKMVIHVWAQRTQKEGRNSGRTVYFQGDTIYSYGSHFPIARFVENRRGETCVLFTTRDYSCTTARHKNSVRYAIPDQYPIFYVSKVLDDSPYDADQHDKQWGEFLFEINEVTSSYDHAKTSSTQYRAIERKLSLIENANGYAAFFGLRRKITGQKRVKTLLQRLDKAQIAAAEKRITAQQQRDAAAFRQWHNGLSRTCPCSYALKGGKWARVTYHKDSDKVVTSLGAAVPGAHVRAAWRIIKPLLETHTAWKARGHCITLGQFRLDAIDSGGTVHAGCHRIQRTEVERLAKMMGLS